MKLPIIITENMDVSVHPTVDHAETFIESVDVREGIFTVYDSEGFVLDLIMETKQKENHFLFFKWTTAFEKVTIREKKLQQHDSSSELKKKLLKYLEYKGVKAEEMASFSVNDLIVEVSKYMPWKMT